MAVDQNLFGPLFLFLERNCRTRGILDTVRQVKLCRLAQHRFQSGQSPPGGIRVTHDGLPVVFGPLIGELRSDNASYYLQQALTTVLSSTRALALGKDLDVSSIEGAPYPAKAVDMEPSVRELSLFWAILQEPGRDRPKELDFEAFHLTTKAGPNGHAQSTWWKDLLSLDSSHIEDLSIVGGHKLAAHLQLLRSNLDLIPGLLPEFRGQIRRLAHFPDKELKVRVIGVLDYFSQAALFPLHKWLFRILDRIPQDCTFDHGSWITKAQGWQVYHSVDLTAATDRFPAILIANVLQGRLPASYVQAWQRLMTKSPFWVAAEQRFVSYSTGQPMGAYSSWTSFALAHHFVVFQCCRRLGIRWSTAPYCLLGDDIVIGHTGLADEYREALCRLGVGVSETKTFSSPYFAEFAKRILYKGKEITPFPLSALPEAASRYFFQGNLFGEAARRGWTPSLDTIGLVESFYKTFTTFRSAQANRQGWKALLSVRMMEIMRGLRPAADQVNQLVGGRSQLPNISDKISESILQNVIVECFADSNPCNNDKSKTGRPLGQLAIDLVTYYSGQIETRPEALDMIYAHPFLNCYGRVEEMYQKVSRTAAAIDRAGEDWPLMMRVIALPLDDSFFVERTSRTIIRGGDRVATLLAQRIEVLTEYPQMQEF